MAKRVKFRRGSTAQHAAFTGSEAEMTYDTTKKTFIAHDGVTAGGHPMVTETQNAAFKAEVQQDLAEVQALANLAFLHSLASSF